MKQTKKDTLEIITAEIANVKANRYMTPEEKATKIKQLQQLLK